MGSRFTLSLLLLLLGAGGCAGNQASGDNPPARARIENDTSLDMDIYLHRQSGPANRLGFVPAGQTVEFDLPKALMAGAVSVRFEARPVRRGGRTVFSDLFGVQPGDVVEWSIPAQ